jgi:hypothetical protein
MPGQSHINQSHLSSLQRITAPNATHSLQQSTTNPVSLRSRDRHSTIEAGLWDLAGLTPWIGGGAVYTARIILGYDPDEHGVPYRLKDSTRVFAKSQNLLVFPNPANEIVTLRFDNITQAKADFYLYDYTGKAVLVTTIPAGTKEYIINIERVKSGLLLYSIRAGSKTFSGKIIKL